jgi:nucleotide-binding universal stress UspA family protein
MLSPGTEEVDMYAERNGRVIVAVDDGLSGLNALRRAVAEARQRRTMLYAVRAWNMTFSWDLSAVSLRHELARDALSFAYRSFDLAMGGLPVDLDVRIETAFGKTGQALVDYADRDGDLLVVGAGRHSLLHGWRPAVARYCVGRAGCAVLVVPAPILAREIRPRLFRGRLRWQADELVTTAKSL